MNMTMTSDQVSAPGGDFPGPAASATLGKAAATISESQNRRRFLTRSALLFRDPF